MEKISAVYKITNTVTGDFYVGSSKNVKHRWAAHKWPSRWNQYPNNPMYQDIQKYGVDKFVFEILAEVEVDKLKEAEQQFIETLKPTYNNRNADGWNVERYKELNNQYYESHKEQIKQSGNKYNNQLCNFNGQTLTLNALSCRFKRKGIPHPIIEAKKYLLNK